MNVNNITDAVVNSSSDVAAVNADIIVFNIENNTIFKSIEGDFAFNIKKILTDEFKRINDFKCTIQTFVNFLKGQDTFTDFLTNKKSQIDMVRFYIDRKLYNVPVYELWLFYLRDNGIIMINTIEMAKHCLEMFLIITYIAKFSYESGLEVEIVNLHQSNIAIHIKYNTKIKATYVIPINNVNPPYTQYMFGTHTHKTRGTTNRLIISINEYVPKSAPSPLMSVKTAITLATTDLNKTNQAMYSEFLDFYRNVLLKAPEATKSAQFSKTRDITVYAISYKKMDEVKTVENPEYVEWMEMFGNIAKTVAGDPQAAVEDQQQKPSAAAPSQQQSYDMLAKMEAYRMKPPKTIEIRCQKTELVCEKVNQLYKNMNSLYLREADKHKITSIVDKFKTRRDFYEQLGIPYKLGIMLHGHPGTGKSSTIKAIASTLEKDIYFVNLKNVRTNAELKGIFDHINEKCNGGVIVFEDMDASCEVIKRRHCGANASDIVETRPDSVADITDHVADDKLTLSYLLNLFDGTICRDGTIFAITTNHLENIDPALYRAGRVDVKIEFRKCDHYQIREIFRHVIGRELATDVLAAIPEWKYSPAEIIYEIMHYGLDDSVTDREIMSAFINTQQ